VDFAEFRVESANEPGLERKVWLFAMVLGRSRYLWAQFVVHQDLPTVLRCRTEAFEHFGGAPREILYDRMKTAVLGEPDEDKPIIYNAKLLACGAHYGFGPRGRQPCRRRCRALNKASSQRWKPSRRCWARNTRRARAGASRWSCRPHD
jgi:transposase